MSQPVVRFRLNSNGAQWFNPVNRQWLPMDEVVTDNIRRILYETFGWNLETYV